MEWLTEFLPKWILRIVIICHKCILMIGSIFPEMYGGIFVTNCIWSNLSDCQFSFKNSKTNVRFKRCEVWISNNLNRQELFFYLDMNLRFVLSLSPTFHECVKNFSSPPFPDLRIMNECCGNVHTSLNIQKICKNEASHRSAHRGEIYSFERHKKFLSYRRNNYLKKRSIKRQRNHLRLFE